VGKSGRDLGYQRTRRQLKAIEDLAIGSAGKYAADQGWASSTTWQAMQNLKDCMMPSAIERMIEDLKVMGQTRAEEVFGPGWSIARKFFQEEEERNRLMDPMKEMREATRTMENTYRFGFDGLDGIMATLNEPLPTPTFTLKDLKPKILANEVMAQIAEEVRKYRATLASDEELIIEYGLAGQKIFLSKIEACPPDFLRLYWVDGDLGERKTFVYAGAIAITFGKVKKSDIKGPIGFQFEG
jgi:hypothetical protein